MDLLELRDKFKKSPSQMTSEELHNLVKLLREEKANSGRKLARGTPKTKEPKEVKAIDLDAVLKALGGK